jgi:hypothetical protein
VEDLGATTLAQERRAVDYDIIIKIRIATYGKSGVLAERRGQRHREGRGAAGGKP